MGFFVHSNKLEIRVRGQDSLKIQKFIQRNSKVAIAIYLCNIYIVFPHIVSAETILFWIWKSKGHST